MAQCLYFGEPDNYINKNCMSKNLKCRDCAEKAECWEIRNQNKAYRVATHKIHVTCDAIYELDLISAMVAIEKYIKKKLSKIPDCKLRQLGGMDYVNEDEID